MPFPGKKSLASTREEDDVNVTSSAEVRIEDTGTVARKAEAFPPVLCPKNGSVDSAALSAKSINEEDSLVICLSWRSCNASVNPREYGSWSCSVWTGAWIFALNSELAFGPAVTLLCRDMIIFSSSGEPSLSKPRSGDRSSDGVACFFSSPIFGSSDKVCKFKCSEDLSKRYGEITCDGIPSSW